jgi:hypothetical protein
MAANRRSKQMRLTAILLIPIFAVGMTSCAVSGQVPEAPPSAWNVGFWFWQGSEVTVESEDLPIDVVFFHAGRISQDELAPQQWYVGADLPSRLPRAREYWMVLRYERQRVPALAAIPRFTESLSSIQSEARRRQIPLTGLQLDIDAPTGSLHEYAALLHELRKTLPNGMQLSITALLDWFRDGTALSEVLKEVDEFVPQFYDVSDIQPHLGGVYLPVTEPINIRPVAAVIDSQIWATRFNKYAKRYRIGISTFGRSALVSKGALRMYGDLTPLAIAVNSAFTLQTERTPARELLLKYRAIRKTKISYERFEPGDLVEFMMPTSEAVRNAYNNAKRMGSYCLGVLFFRWPVPDHEIALSAADVLTVIGSRPGTLTPRVIARDGGCAVVHCVDLHVLNLDWQSEDHLRYSITSSVPFEYFLPEKDIPVRPAGPNHLELVLPPFAGADHLFLGRAVTATASEFSVSKGS